jgi:hypothetical protein
MAVDLATFDVVARCWAAARADRPNVLVIGRHSRCDVHLPDPASSLRELAVIIPAAAEPAPRFTLHDLRTPDGFWSADSLPMRGATVSRAGVFRIGRYALFAFATHPELAWHDLPTETWEWWRGADGVSIDRPAEPSAADAEVSSRVSSIAGPSWTRTCRTRTPRGTRGTLVLETGGTVAQLPLDDREVGNGVLVGRASRCQVGADHDAISRVHMMVIELEGELFGFDTASTNGVAAGDGKLLRVLALSRGETGSLAGVQEIRLAR